MSKMLPSTSNNFQWYVLLLTGIVCLLLAIDVSTVSAIEHIQHVIENKHNAIHIHPVDFDKDGDTDVVTATNTGIGNGGGFAWYERTSDTTTFDKHPIGGANYARSIYPVDFDGDGDLDVVTAAPGDDKFAWYEQTADSITFEEHVIESGSNADRAIYIRPVDFDDDGDTDVVTSARTADEFAWYERTSDSTTFDRHVIEKENNATGAQSISPVDFDGDGDMDVVTADRNEMFAWHERTSDSTTFDRHVIEQGANAAGAVSIKPVDFDGDGDTDVVTAARRDNEFAWYEQTTDATTFERHVIQEGKQAKFGHFIRPVDFDGDGDFDVVTAAEGASEFAWYEQTVDSTTFSRHLINSKGETDARTIYPVDFDGDDDKDVVTATRGGDVFAWHESVNFPPTISSSIPDQIEEEDTGPWTISLKNRANDPDGDDLKWLVTGGGTVVSASLNDGGYVSGGNDDLTFTPVSNANGTDTFSVAVGDGTDTTPVDTFTIKLTPEYASEISIDTVIHPGTTTVTLADTQVAETTKKMFTAVAMDSSGFNSNISANPKSAANGDSVSRATRNYRFILPLLKDGHDTLTLDIWTNQSPWTGFYGLRTDTTAVDTDSLPGRLDQSDTGRRALGRTAFLLEFADSENRLLGSDTETTQVGSRFSYVAHYTLSRETTRLFADLGFDTSSVSDDFKFNFADTFGANWQPDTFSVTVDSNPRSGIDIRVAVLDKDLPGSLGGANNSPNSGAAGGSGCLIQRMGTPQDTLTRLRDIRDQMLDTVVGRIIAEWYYDL